MTFEIHGHRGARGLAPENTLAGFATALCCGVTALEIDVAVTHQDAVLVHHDFRLNGNIARVGGEWVNGEAATIHSLSPEDLPGIDVGRLRPGTEYTAKFPGQRPADGELIPTLREVVELTRSCGADEVRFNIEIKTTPVEPGLTAPPGHTAAVLTALLEELDIGARAIVQSFDWRVIQAVQQIAPALKTGYTTVEQPWYDSIQRDREQASPWLAGQRLDRVDGSLPRLVHAAGGALWLPYFGDLTAATLAEAHALGLLVMVWTVNEARDMRALIEMGVDGITTDYPGRLRDVAQSLGLPLPAPVPAACR